MAEPQRFRPKAYPPPEFPPRRLPLFARMPPAVFPSLMGLLGLGLALRRGLPLLDLPVEVAEVVLGAASALWAFAAFGYLVKIARRPAVLGEDLRILPGRAGLAAAVLGLLLVATVVAPYQAALAWGLMVAGLALHLALALLVLRLWIAAPPEGREITPVWQLNFAGFIIGALPALALGMAGLAGWLLWLTIPLAVAIWLVSAVQLVRRNPPAPLRPLLAIHLAPASLFATVAAGLGQTGLALGFAALGAAMLVALVGAVRWITSSGFSALWGAFTFPAAAFASALFALDLAATGTIALILALGVVPFVTFRVLKLWAGGQLAARTNAATA